MEYKSWVICLNKEEMATVITLPNEQPSGIIMGLVTDVLAFPLLAGASVLGAWMLYLAVMKERSFLILVMGFMFFAGGCVLLIMLADFQMACFPVKWKVKRITNGTWQIEKYVWMFRTMRRQVSKCSLQCYPSYSRGDWGYYFGIFQRV